ncbi:MAG: Stp1/IreP family PP2C-type Ser/Thr phosphatase [Thermoleophilia bacterium]|nr:Stp1/IreP family PP2C-type Ser/Thr phosphatase [Thermoleophilia bacterium]
MLRVSQHSERTDTGRQRQANEDSFLVREPLFVVADGMGGAQAGEVASMTAVQAFEGGLPPGDPEEALQVSIGLANRTIHNQAHADASLAGMGTTITAAAVNPEAETIVIGHVGDSRAYRLRDGILQRLTRDHSLVEEMRRRGQITEAQAEDHPQRSIITRALGPEPEVEADIQSVPSAPGDLFMLCSDGLTTMLGDERIKELLMGATSLDAATNALVDEANRAGGRDNITVVLFQVEDPENPLAAPGEQPTLISPAARSGPAGDGNGAVTGVPHRERRTGAIAARLALGLAVLAVVAGGLFYAAHQLWFLGTDSAGRVALYQGLPYELPFGLSMYEEKYSTAVQTDELSAQRQDSVTGHSLRSKDDATSLIEDIESREGI